MKQLFALLALLTLFASQGIARDLARSPHNLVEAAQKAANTLDQATASLVRAETASDRVRALTQSIRSIEHALALVRQGLREMAMETAAIDAHLTRQEDEIGRLLGVLHSIDKDTVYSSLIHPSGPLATARAGMMLSDIVPALQNRVTALQRELEDQNALIAFQTEIRDALKLGLSEVQHARTALARALADRKDLPRRFTEDPSKTEILLTAADSLDAFADGVAIIAADEVPGSLPYIGNRKGALPFPVAGRIIRQFNETDAAGIVRPGLVVATASQAIVTTPTAATIRYRGPLLDYGQVSIIEPQIGVLIIVAGMETVYGNIGEVLPAGSPIGIMGGQSQSFEKIIEQTVIGNGSERPETLYIEVRNDNIPQDPLLWFGQGKDLKK